MLSQIPVSNVTAVLILIGSCPYGNLQSSRYIKLITVTVNLQYNSFLRVTSFSVLEVMTQLHEIVLIQHFGKSSVFLFSNITPSYSAISSFSFRHK